MIERCKECPHCQTNNVYPLSNREYCNKWHYEVESERNACKYAQKFLKTEDKPKIKKKLFDCTLQEISEMCVKHDNHCKDTNGDFCPLMAVNDPFNECILIHMAKNPGDWQKFKDNEI